MGREGEVGLPRFLWKKGGRTARYGTTFHPEKKRTIEHDSEKKQGPKTGKELMKNLNGQKGSKMGKPEDGKAN